MEIQIDPNSGFCFGVVYAIQMAEDVLEDGEVLYCLGDIVHNDREVERLKKKGLRIISHEDLHQLRDCKVLIRAHGEPPSTYELAIRQNITLIDASCPVVLKLQNRIKNTYDRFGGEGQIVIYGKPGHAEVNGLKGQTEQKAIIVYKEEDLDKINYSKPVQFFSQTTKSTEDFYRLKEEIIRRAAKKGNAEVTANDTICRQVSNREPSLRKFAAEYDKIVFVAGRKSSNGKVLFEVCREVNPDSYFISTEEELCEEWFEPDDRIGICGATSTPMWLMEKVASAIKDIVPA